MPGRPAYEELARRDTPLGELMLRRRLLPGPGDLDVHEIKLNGELLMSSLVDESEQALAHLAIPLAGDGPLDVLVGGLGLGHTVWAALGYERVRSVTVVELLPEVIDWHEQGLVPLGSQLVGDRRCRFLEGDFYVLATDEAVRDLLHPAQGYGAILVDIDHSPQALLRSEHARFYEPAALSVLRSRLQPGGVFALWSTGQALEAFVVTLRGVFDSVQTHALEFFNPVADRDELNTIYLATRRS